MFLRKQILALEHAAGEYFDNSLAIILRSHSTQVTMCNIGQSGNKNIASAGSLRFLINGVTTRVSV